MMAARLSVGDFVMSFIQGLDPAKKDSPIYDKSLALSINAGLKSLRDIELLPPPTDDRILQRFLQFRCRIEHSAMWPTSPYGLSGENSWPILAISNLAEANKELAYTSDKSDTLQS